MNPVADLRAAVMSLNHVPDGTPIEPTLAFGAPNALVYDQANNVVRLSVGWGRATGRPTMGQLRSWLGVALPATPAAAAVSAAAEKATEVLNGLSGPWASMVGREPFTLRGMLTFASAAASGYHGSRRNGGSILWGLWWFAWGAMLPGLVPIVAVAQGYGDCKNDCSK